MIVPNMNVAWRWAMCEVRDRSTPCRRNGFSMMEVPHFTIVVDLTSPVLTLSGRKLDYKRMAALAHWVLSGSDRLVEISPYDPEILHKSEDGVTVPGAYGPRVTSQIAWIVDKLMANENTSQAVMPIWTPLPMPARDIPTVIAADFKLRNGKIDVHLFMRSCDAWYSLPYDVFIFAMIAVAVRADYNAARSADTVGLGTLYLTTSALYLYAPELRQFTEAHPDAWADPPPAPLPKTLTDNGRGTQMLYLRNLKDTPAEHLLRWWQRPSTEPAAPPEIGPDAKP